MPSLPFGLEFSGRSDAGARLARRGLQVVDGDGERGPPRSCSRAAARHQCPGPRADRPRSARPGARPSRGPAWRRRARRAAPTGSVGRASGPRGALRATSPETVAAAPPRARRSSRASRGRASWTTKLPRGGSDRSCALRERERRAFHSDRVLGREHEERRRDFRTRLALDRHRVLGHRLEERASGVLRRRAAPISPSEDEVREDRPGPITRGLCRRPRSRRRGSARRRRSASNRA